MFDPDPSQLNLLHTTGNVGFYKVAPKAYNVLSSSYYYWQNHETKKWHGPFVTAVEAVYNYERSLIPVEIDTSKVISVDFTAKKRVR